MPGLAAEGPEILLSDLGLRPLVIGKLASMGLYRVEDLTEVSEFELRVAKHIGELSVKRLLEVLLQHGLAFKINNNPALALHERARSMRKLPTEHRNKLVSPDADVSVLGLGPVAFASCIKHRFATVGSLLSLQPREFQRYFGTKSAQEIIRAIEGAGLRLLTASTELEMWRCGLRLATEMTPPKDDDLVVELQPWLGSLALIAMRQGVVSVKDLRNAVSKGVSIKGIGKSSRERLQAYFGKGNSSTARAASVFNL